MFNPSPSLIVICGPPLPGRTELARALAARRGATLFTVRDGPPPADEVRAAFARELDVIVDGELPRRSQRLEVLALAPDGKSALLVEWIGSHEQAEREAFQRYAGRPRPIEEAALKAYEADVAAREPIAGEVPEDRLVIVSSAASLLDQTLAVEGALPPRTLPEAQAAPPPRRVLVVEDDADTRKSLTLVLRELGYEAEGVGTGHEALARLERGPRVDAILVDQRMPGMSGTDLVAEIHARKPEARAIMLTAFGDDPTCAAALRARVDNVLAKPLRVMDLQRALDELLG